MDHICYLQRVYRNIYERKHSVSKKKCLMIIIEAYYQKMTLPTKPLVSKITCVMIMVVAYFEKMTCT